MIYSNTYILGGRVPDYKGVFAYYGDSSIDNSIYRVWLRLPHWFRNLKKGLSRNIHVKREESGRLSAVVCSEAKDSMFLMLTSEKGSCTRGNGDIYLLKEYKQNAKVIQADRVGGFESGYMAAIIELTGPCMVRIRYSGGLPNTIIHYDGANIGELEPNQCSTALKKDGVKDPFFYDDAKIVISENNRFEKSEWAKIGR